MTKELATLATALAAASCASSPRPLPPRCPDDSQPRFTGHPFRTFSCPALERVQAKPSPPPESTLPNRAELAKTSLEPLLGRWEGLAYYGDGRYNVSLTMSKSGRSYRAVWSTLEQHALDKKELAAELTAFILQRGHYDLSVRMAPLPALRGELWVGAPPAAATGYDLDAVASYPERAGWHEALFSLVGPDRLRYRYTYFAPDGGPVRAEGELTRER